MKFISNCFSGDMMEYNLNGPGIMFKVGLTLLHHPQWIWTSSGKALESSVFRRKHVSHSAVRQGPVILNSFGAVYPIQVNGEYIVDTDHIVAFEETLNYEVSKAGKSWLSSILGGEGLVCKFRGQGTVWCQSHNAGSFGASWAPT